MINPHETETANTGLVSVIIPIFNGEKWIEKTLQSLLAQTYSNWECLVVNDGSTDESARLVLRAIEAYPDRKIKLIQIPNSGVSVARNKGLENASGEYVALLDCDDLWTKDKLEKQVELLAGDAEVGAVLCDFFISENLANGLTRKARLITQRRTESLSRGWLSLQGNGALLSSTLLFRRSPATSDLRFSSELNTTADLDFFLNLEKVVKVGHISHPLVEYRQHDGQMHLDPNALKSEYSLLLSKLQVLPIPLTRTLLQSNVLVMSALLNFRSGAFGEGLEDLRKATHIRPLSLVTLPLFILLKRFRGYSSRILRGRR